MIENEKEFWVGLLGVCAFIIMGAILPMNSVVKTVIFYAILAIFTVWYSIWIGISIERMEQGE